MTNDKAQMTNQDQNPNDEKESFWHLTCPPELGRRGIWISIVIGILEFGFVWGRACPAIFVCHCERSVAIPLSRDCFVAMLLAMMVGKGEGRLSPPLLGITFTSPSRKGQVGCAYTRRVLKMSTMTTITRTAPMAITTQTQVGVAGWAGCIASMCAWSSA